MAGVKRLRELQLAKEATAGTKLAATIKWGGNGVLIDEGPIEFVDPDVGNLIADATTYRPYSEGSIVFDEMPATFETLPYILSASIENIQTAAADTGGSGHIWQYDYPTTAVATAPRTFTIEAGDNQEADAMEYSFVEEFTISGAAQEALMVTATWRGRQLTDTGLTAGLTVPTQEEILFQKGKFYVNTTSVSTATQLTATVVAFEFGGPSGWKPIYAADGNLYFSALKNVGPELEGSFTFEVDATGEAQRGYAQAETVQYCRAEWSGAALTTAGSSYTYKTLRIDFAFKYTEVPSLEDDDGNDQYTIPFRVVSNANPQIIVVNEVETI